MDLSEAITLAGATILVGILVEALKRAMAWGADQVERFGALVAIVVGVLVVVVLSAAQGTIQGDQAAQAAASAIITGVLAGAAASGLYDGSKVVAAKVSGNDRQGPQDAPGQPTDPGAAPGAGGTGTQ